MTKATDALKRRRRLLAIRKQGSLTVAGLAELAGEGTSLKIVERWLADPKAASYRPIPAHRLELIEHNLAAKKTKEKKP